MVALTLFTSIDGSLPCQAGIEMLRSAGSGLDAAVCCGSGGLFDAHHRQTLQLGPATAGRAERRGTPLSSAIPAISMPTSDASTTKVFSLMVCLLLSRLWG
jgi:hypothetical protein